MLVFKPAICRDEHVALQLPNDHFIFQVLPSQIEKSLHFVPGECLYNSRVHAGVYDDTHDN
ncbi:hypothetical protein F183_A39990 [Bryobacterales bacterium F-183]|nr:hypothetical protein F183_A39990 [Bryobacterales bacterium F-183]